MEKLENAHKFKLWKSHLIKNGIKISNIQEVFTRKNSSGEILFSLLLLNARTPEGNLVPPVCFLKGEVVIVLLCLIDQDTGEKFLLLVSQRRIADGALSYEHPAGMVDHTKTPLQTALQEVQEETGLIITEDQIKSILTQNRLFPSTGTSDECIYYFYVELYQNKKDITALHNQKRGNSSENEHITTHVLPFINAHSLMNNANCILLNLAYLKAVEDWSLLKKLPL